MTKQYSYSEVYHVMNELSLCQSGLDEIKVLVSTALDSFNDNYPGRSETDQLLSVTYKFLKYFTDEYDKKFQNAWSVAIQAARELDDVKAKLSRLENPENPQYTEEEMTAMCNQQDRVVKWVLPVEQFAGSDEYLISFPEDLLEAANLKEGDMVEWIDRGDGSYQIRKVD
jgi:hypothetical protein